MPNRSGSSRAGASSLAMAAAIAAVVLAAAFGYLVTTFFFAFSGGQARMVGVVNLVAVSVVVSSFAVAAVVWVLSSPMHALQWRQSRL